MRLKYYIVTVMVFQAEDYHNAGINYKRVKELIESISCPSGLGKLRADSAGINGNWEVRLYHDSYINYVYDSIRDALMAELAMMKGKSNVA